MTHYFLLALLGFFAARIIATIYSIPVFSLLRPLTRYNIVYANYLGQGRGTWIEYLKPCANLSLWYPTRPTAGRDDVARFISLPILINDLPA